MLLLAGAVIGLLAGLATGGSLRRLAEIRLRWPLLLIAALAVKELGLRGPLSSFGGTPWLFVASSLAVLAWTLWHRDQVPGILLVSAGLAMNLVVVLANLGRMPVAPELAGQGPHQLLQKGVWGQYILASSSTNLNWLGDWIELPGPVGRLFPQAYSPGDLVAFCGMVAVLFLATRRRRPASTPPITIS